MENKPNILIVNDDGIHAPGIRHLWNALKDRANLTIIAPAHEQSGVGLSITFRQPLHIRRIDWPENTPAWHVTGTPADCIKMGLSVILKEKPDLVVSGINRGTNAGRNVLYSGTVGGTIEAVMKDIPAIAFSCWEFTETPSYDLAEQYIPGIVDHVLEHSLPKGTLLNVNFPNEMHKQMKGIRFARQGQGFWGEDPSERRHPAEGSSYYWMGAQMKEFDEHEDSDIALLRQGYTTVVPVHVGELTDLKHFHEHKEIFEERFGEIRT